MTVYHTGVPNITCWVFTDIGISGVNDDISFVSMISGVPELYYAPYDIINSLLHHVRGNRSDGNDHVAMLECPDGDNRIIMRYGQQTVVFDTCNMKCCRTPEGYMYNGGRRYSVSSMTYPLVCQPMLRYTINGGVVTIYYTISEIQHGFNTTKTLNSATTRV